MQVSPSVRAVQVPDANPMHPDFTTIYLVGKGQTLSIDSGETMDRYRWMLKGYLAAVEKTEIALAGITHHHGDHSGNLKWVREELHAEIVTAKDAVPLLKGRLPRTGVRTFAPEVSMIRVLYCRLAEIYRSRSASALAPGRLPGSPRMAMLSSAVPE